MPSLDRPIIGRLLVLDAIPRVVCGTLCDPVAIDEIEVNPGETRYWNAIPNDIARTRFQVSPSGIRMDQDAHECSRRGNLLHFLLIMIIEIG